MDGSSGQATLADEGECLLGKQVPTVEPDRSVQPAGVVEAEAGELSWAAAVRMGPEGHVHQKQITRVGQQCRVRHTAAIFAADGVLRVVVSKQDPGIHNWLDKANFPWGILQMRLYHASLHPEVQVTKVSIAELSKHLPAATPAVSPAQRQESLAARREGAQLRRIW
jgi:hypothetical protein